MPLIIVIIFLYMPYIISCQKLLQCCKVNTPIPDEKPKADRLERIRKVKGMKYTSCLARMAL